MGRKAIDLRGQDFGNLVALEPTDYRQNKQVVWKCVCVCGNTAYVPAGNLRSGHTKSCGCGRWTYSPNDYRIAEDVAYLHMAGGFTTMVSVPDLPTALSRRWYVGNRGYAVSSDKRGGRRRTILLHRRIMGTDVSDAQCDHINGDRLDNRRSNLRVATRSENAQNVTVVRAASGYKGVCYQEPSWVAGIKYKGRRRYLGSFPTAVEAAVAYNNAAVELFGRFAFLNEIPE